MPAPSHIPFRDIDPEEFRCPRCGGHIPSSLMPGAYPGVPSRVADVEVCSGCTWDELRRLDDGAVLPAPADWPIRRTPVGISEWAASPDTHELARVGFSGGPGEIIVYDAPAGAFSSPEVVSEVALIDTDRAIVLVSAAHLDRVRAEGGDPIEWAISEAITYLGRVFGEPA